MSDDNDTLVVDAATFDATVVWDRTGLAGTLGARITDAATTVLTRVTAGVAEYPAGSGVYQATLTTPAVLGQATLVWDDGFRFDIKDLFITLPSVSTGTAGLFDQPFPSLFTLFDATAPALAAFGLTTALTGFDAPSPALTTFDEPEPE